jgi:tetratricopeptide (TPR) repeat protein
VGTNKLTRKEILSEDPVRATIKQLIEFAKVRGSFVLYIAAAIVVLSFGIYGGLQYLDSRDAVAQERLNMGIEFFHGQVAPDATGDPYGKGHIPVFKSDAAKYQAAAKEFSDLASGYGYPKVSIIARYYLGLTQIQLGQKKDALQNLEAAAGSSRVRIISFLAKKVLGKIEGDAGNYKRAKEIFDDLIKDPQCNLPKEDLSIELSRVLVAQGKRDEAIKVLRDAGAQGAAFSMLKQQVALELDKIQKGQVPPAHP